MEGEKGPSQEEINEAYKINELVEQGKLTPQEAAGIPKEKTVEEAVAEKSGEREGQVFTEEDFEHQVEDDKQDMFRQLDEIIADKEAAGDSEGAEIFKKQKEEVLKRDKTDWSLSSLNNITRNVAWAVIDTEGEFGTKEVRRIKGGQHFRSHVGIKSPEEWAERYAYDMRKVLDSLGLQEEWEQYRKAISEKCDTSEDADKILEKNGLKSEYEKYIQEEINRRIMERTSPQRKVERMARRHVADTFVKIYIAMRNKGWNWYEICQ